MLCFGRSALWLKRGTACSLSVILPCGDKRGIDSWSLVASGGENFDKRCRDFAFGKIAESPKFSGEEDSSLQTAFPLCTSEAVYPHQRCLWTVPTKLWQVYPDTISPVPVLTEGRTTFRANECSIESPCTATHGCSAPYFREAGNKNAVYQNPI